jgi:hypothetical protein
MSESQGAALITMFCISMFLVIVASGPMEDTGKWRIGCWIAAALFGLPPIALLWMKGVLG